MNPSIYTPLRVIPETMHTHLLARLVNHMLRGQSLVERLEEMDGKVIGIHVSDAELNLNFQIEQGQLMPVSAKQPDVTISGNANGFWLLASQKEDPDTLFFQRELCIEGETETGVHIKNILDALEYDIDAHIDDVLIAPIAMPVKRVVARVRRLHMAYRNKRYH